MKCAKKKRINVYSTVYHYIKKRMTEVRFIYGYEEKINLIGLNRYVVTIKKYQSRTFCTSRVVIQTGKGVMYLLYCDLQTEPPPEEEQNLRSYF